MIVRVQTETEKVAHGDVLSQGDIVQIEWPEGETGPTLGVIINADCDLAHDKTDGVVALAPIYSFEEYLADFWAPGHVRDVAISAAQAVLKLAGDTDEEALRAWLCVSDVEVVANSLTEYRRLKPAQIAKLKLELHRLAVCLDETQTPISKFKALCGAAENPAGYARSQLTAAKKAMGEGHFFVSDLVGHPALGFVVRLRRVYVLPVEDVFTSTSLQRSRSDGERATAVRIARFTSLYRFRVLQLFAQQYSRVGLPDELSALSALAVDDLVATYSGV